MAKRWKPSDEAYLKRYAKQRRVSELAQRFKTDHATILLKLRELDVDALDSVEPTPLEGSHQLELFERALKALHASKWQQAVEGFERTIAESDQPDLTNRARRYLSIARERLKGSPKEEADDPYLQAVFERNRGNFDAALAIASAGGRRSKDAKYAYLVASIHVARGDLDQAAEFLAVAIELDPMSRIHALNDAEFAELLATPKHAGLFAS
jgi:tetratricopeptide (TPR) repeat protein